MGRNLSIQHLRGVFANIPTLNVGELYLTTDTNKLYVGTSGGNLLVGPATGGLAAQGVTTINFGVFPGASDAKVVITGQTGILAGSIVNAFLISTATADHSVDEHWLDGPEISAGNIVAGTGFTIYGRNKNQAEVDDSTWSTLNQNKNIPLCYGLWTVGWLWN